MREVYFCLPPLLLYRQGTPENWPPFSVKKMKNEGNSNIWKKISIKTATTCRSFTWGHTLTLIRKFGDDDDTILLYYAYGIISMG